MICTARQVLGPSESASARAWRRCRATYCAGGEGERTATLFRVRAGLEYDVCLYDIRHLWITTMLDKKVEIPGIAHLAGTSPRVIIKNYYEAHASETEKAAELLPRLGTAMGAPLRLAKPVKLA